MARSVTVFMSDSMSDSHDLCKDPGCAQTLALRLWADDSESNSKLVTVRVDGTEYRDLFGPIKGFGIADQIGWTPDGQFILFTAFGFTGPRPKAAGG